MISKSNLHDGMKNGLQLLIGILLRVSNGDEQNQGESKLNCKGIY